MPAQETSLTPLDYETPTPRPSIGEVIFRNLPLVCWGIAIVLCMGMVFEVFGSLRRTSGSTDPQIDALNWAWTAVALRAAVALARRERTWWSLAYIALFFVLAIVTEVATKWWRSTL
jgi:ABC-type Co2+ transport system permease subunit